MTVVVEMSERQVEALGAVTGMLVDVDRTINQLLAVKDGLLAVGSRLAMEVGADAVAALSADAATGIDTSADLRATGVHATVAGTATTSAAGAEAGASGSQAAEAMELAGRAVAGEFAAALRVSDRTVQRRMGEADSIVSLFPGVWRSQGAGRISAAHARVIVDAGAYLEDPVARKAYEERLVGFAETTSPNRVGRMARRVAERFQARTIDDRHRDARRQRRAWVNDRPDGMAVLGVLGPAALIHGAHDRLTALGLGLGLLHDTNARTDNRDDRCLDEIRADLALDLLLTGTPAGHDPDGLLSGIRGTVSITAPLATLAGTAGSGDWGAAGDGPPAGGNSHAGIGAIPAELNGRIPIDTATARRLAANASGWDRVFTHPITGAVLAVDRYRPSAELKRWLHARDQRCRFPGCGHPARDCDIDHTEDAAAGGSTAVSNLGALCRRHHVTKHQTPWTVQQLDTGVFAWTSPTGRTYLDRPPPLNTTTTNERGEPPPF